MIEDITTSDAMNLRAALQEVGSTHANDGRRVLERWLLEERAGLLRFAIGAKELLAEFIVALPGPR